LLDKKATVLAELALTGRKSTPAKFEQVKAGILKRLRDKQNGQDALPDAPPPPDSPPPESDDSSEGPDDQMPTDCPTFELSGGDWVDSRREKKTVVVAERAAEREKRKAIWGKRAREPEEEAESGQLSANAWERRRLGDAETKNKFLRLMGGQRFASKAAAATEGVLFDEELPADCPTFELSCEGDWVAAAASEEKAAVEKADAEAAVRQREEELERLYVKGLQRTRRKGHQGLGLGSW